MKSILICLLASIGMAGCGSRASDSSTASIGRLKGTKTGSPTNPEPTKSVPKCWEEDVAKLSEDGGFKVSLKVNQSTYPLAAVLSQLNGMAKQQMAHFDYLSDETTLYIYVHTLASPVLGEAPKVPADREAFKAQVTASLAGIVNLPGVVIECPLNLNVPVGIAGVSN